MRAMTASCNFPVARSPLKLSVYFVTPPPPPPGGGGGGGGGGKEDRNVTLIVVNGVNIISDHTHL